MDIPASEVGYISATTGRGDHEVHKGHVVVVGKERKRGKKEKSLKSSHQENIQAPF
jgi:hypothetical protein